MTALDVLREARRRGVNLIPEGQYVRVRGPRGTLTPDLLEKILECKPELLEILARPTIRDLPRLDADDSSRVFLVLDDGAVVRAPRRTGTKSCPACGHFAWWRSVYASVACGRCHPPAAPELVASWLEDRG